MTVTALASAPAAVPVRRPRRRGALLALAALALAGAVLLSLLVGNQPISPAQLVAGLTDFTGTDADRIVVYLRLPRTVAGVLAGAALGLAGAVTQGLTRNPLGDPGILGINAGASLAAVLALTVFGAVSLTGYVWFAFVGAAVAAGGVYAIGSAGRGGATPVKLALAGAALAALFLSLTSSIAFLNTDTFERFRFWLIGSLTRADLGSVTQAVPFVVVGAALALALGRALNAVHLGDETARSLGVRIRWVRALGVVTVVLLAGTATAVAGPIVFVGLVAPHVARIVAGADHRWLLPWAAVLGSTIMLLADVVGRVVLRLEEVQVGVMAAVLGAPVFLYLVRRRTLAVL
ncbi:MAG: iron ABC transporter permease [Pseudonocardia sp.]|nr:iron ABC transporter permease [Pseudonocardia sp.]